MRMAFLIACGLLIFGCASAQKRAGAGAKAEYGRLMASGDYHSAMVLAKNKGLGREAVVRAALADMRRNVEDDFVFGARMTANAAELTRAEEAAFGREAFDAFMKRGECARAAEAASLFRLGRRHLEAAISCVRREHGVLAALEAACRHGDGVLPLEPMLEEFDRYLADPPKEWTEGIGGPIAACKFGGERSLRLFGKLLEAGNLPRAHDLLKESAEMPGRPDAYHRLFGAAVARKDYGAAKALVHDDAFPRRPEDEAAFVELAALRFECVEALRIVRVRKMAPALAEAVFAHPKCSGVDLSPYEWTIRGDKDEIARAYGFAMTYGQYRLAWALSEHLGQDAFRLVKEAIFRDKAHSVLLELSPPSGMDRDDFLRELFEDALDHDEEWFAATFASRHPEPHTVVERAYLRAMERGERLLAVQIARSYGDPAKLEARARLAFELAMLAREPEEAQDILRAARLDDDALKRRAALLLFEKKREKERERLREERKKLKKKKTSDDWEVKRER